MRPIFTTNDTQLTREMLRWGVRQKKWRRAQPGVFVEGPAPLEPIDLARAKVLAQRTVARGTLAGVLHGLDSVTLDNRPTRRTSPPWLRIWTIDGQHHPGQPVYDARRETAVVATMGWLVGRFTWYEVTALPHTTTRRLAALVEQARRRPLPQSA